MNEQQKAVLRAIASQVRACDQHDLANHPRTDTIVEATGLSREDVMAAFGALVAADCITGNPANLASLDMSNIVVQQSGARILELLDEGRTNE